MSSIIFNTRDAQAEVYGTELAYMEMIISKLTSSLMGSLVENNGAVELPIFKHIPTGHYLHNMLQDKLLSALGTFISAGGFFNNDVFILGDKKIKPKILSYNTAMIAGSDYIKLCTRISSQCYIHCFVMPENLIWFSDLIKGGMKANIFRKDTGWESVIKLVGDTDDSPIVMSHSVYASFPGPEFAGYETDEEIEKWEGYTRDEQWDLAERELLKKSKVQLLELGHDKLDGHYGNGLTAFDFLNCKE